VRLEPDGWLVVKRVRAPKARSLAEELDRLRFARRAPVATPEPVALDVDGAWFGHPALVMGLVPGDGAVHEGSGAWIDSLAATLAAVHATPVDDDGDIPDALRAPHAGIAWRPGPPAELPRTARVKALIDAGLAVGEGPAADGSGRVLLHHDFHHGNVLWQDGRATGVVDWNEARLGPAVCDVAYCRVDLAMSHGVDAADRFTSAHAAAAGAAVDDLDRWTCLWTANAMRWIKYWITGFHEAGVDLPLSVARQRLVELADRTLRSL
jgi:aminoglycoside phosphotransferase (APT) family kinase protein